MKDKTNFKGIFFFGLAIFICLIGEGMFLPVVISSELPLPIIVFSVLLIILGLPMMLYLVFRLMKLNIEVNKFLEKCGE